MTPIDRLRAVHTALEAMLTAATPEPWLDDGPWYHEGSDEGAGLLTSGAELTPGRPARTIVMISPPRSHAWAMGERIAADRLLIALAPVALRVLRDQAAELLAEDAAMAGLYETARTHEHLARSREKSEALHQRFTDWLATAADLVAGLGLEEEPR